ncbi:bifunctional serine/threonine-protein kinase/formylglycine-generating enzyme family protein [Lysobacter koreensis]|uniref:Bifunctional serine/threonine-protein kinase/formylglycine-generating enzyme family protein n=1 Tax=Lysobacter koreensis TaxID=266122 RepID=A0ABW2YSR4_9GAMM
MSSYLDDNQSAPPLPEISGYRLLRVINHGGMSTVYLGEQLALSREVAIKVMSPQALADEVSRRRFENEVRTIARLEHPNVVRIHELGRTRDGLPYYTMPYMARGHLGQRTFMRDDHTPDEAHVVSIANTLYAALEYAHSRGVVHRDVKAENVLFDDAERPLLADFGIALRRGFGPRVTAAGLAVGSTAYMAPEQARGEDVDGRADLYSLGVLIWEMLAGGLPYRAADALSMAVMHAQDPIPKLPPHLRHWQRFMNRALAKNPEQRFHDVAQMREAMAKVKPRHYWPWLAKLRERVVAARRRATPRIATVAVLTVALAGLVFAVGRNRDRGFFRVDAPEVATIEASADPTEAMLEPLPEAPLQRILETARQQLAQRNLTAPEGANAYDSVLEAWHADSTSPEVHEVIAQLTDAMTTQLASNLRDGNDDRARDYYQRASSLGQQTGNADSDAQRKLREQATQALQARMDAAAKTYDRDAAQRTAKLAGELGLPRALVARLTAQAKALPKDGEAVPGDRSRGVLGSGTDGAFVISRKPVSRGDYARFVSATGRPATLCRERVSLLRVFAHKDWKTPGFSQGEGGPVVCVSMADAESYARWHSQQTGHRYRLPTAAESAQTAPEISGRDISLWLRDCGSSCTQRQVSGSSWRSQVNQRPLPSARGYDDVGFRLVREL